jgi:serine/threonine protein kinase/tetratricopeptide (TPR) repeat protein
MANCSGVALSSHDGRPAQEERVTNAAGDWDRVKRVFQSALEQSLATRPTFLDGACGDDRSLRGEVESLLRAHQEAGSFADRPALEGVTARSLSRGDHLGPYDIVELVGAGAMGDVYRARDSKLGRDVAIKVLPPLFSTDADRLARFDREARTLASLNHPHILTVHDIEHVDGHPYLVTEFVDGGTLKTWALSDTRTWRQSVELLVGVADGLAVAHAAGIVHRDVKPDNILISKHGYATLADFGLARLFEADDRAAMPPAATVRTQPGLIVGTIAYMSPEQAAGRPADARSDIFSFGVVLYEVLSGRQPFAGASDLEVLQRVQHQPAEPLSEEIPSALRMVVEKALEKDPAERYQSMRDMVVDLRRLARQTAETPAPVATRSRRGVALAVAALLIIAMVAVALWKMRPTATDAPRIRSIAVLPLQNLSRDPDQEFFSDGTTEALISNLAQIHDLDVISRASSMRYKTTTKTVPQIGRELSVDAIVAGSVQRVGGRVRITAQLIRASTDKHLWAREYERDAADVLTLEAEVARTIAQEIQAHLTPDETRRLAGARQINPDAHEAFLLGHYHRNKILVEEQRQAVPYFERAIQLQPDYAAAWADLSRALWGLRLNGVTNVEGPMRAAAAKAIALDPNLSEAHAAMAMINIADWEWAGAEQEARRAIALDPDVKDSLVMLLNITGRHAEAIALSEHAVRLNPLSAEAHRGYGNVLFWARRYEDAVSRQKQALDLEPRHLGAMSILGAAYEMLGRPQEALAVFDRPEFRESPQIVRVYARLGRREDARRVLNGLVKRGGALDLPSMAIAYFALGDKDRGLEWLTKAFDQRSGFISMAKVNPGFDGIRDDPRFKALVARLKLPD